MDRIEIFNLFTQAFNNQTFKVIKGLNPCVISYKGFSYNIYIKKLTPAQLSNNNPDIWRCQLPKRNVFEEVKNSKEIFLLLGYDAINDVYATWNPYWVKQRLNIGESVSMYSRFSKQIDAKELNDILCIDLNNNWNVILFPRVLLPKYIDDIKKYFAEETTYIAKGSSLRKNKKINIMNNAEYLFEFFSSSERIPAYTKYLSSLSITEKTQKSYIRYIMYV